MAKKKKPAEAAAPESAAASEHATEGSHKRILELPGMVGDGVAKPEIPALDEAVLEYVKERDARIAHGVKEKSNKKLILALMETNSLSSYNVDDYVVVKKPKDETESIKVVALADYTGDQDKTEEI